MKAIRGKMTGEKAAGFVHLFISGYSVAKAARCVGYDQERGEAILRRFIETAWQQVGHVKSKP